MSSTRFFLWVCLGSLVLAGCGSTDVNNDNWHKENIIRYENGALEVYRRPVTITSMTPPKGRVPYLDMLKKMMESRSDVGGHH